MATLFVSDVHLSPARPRILETFLAFLGGPARRAEALYVLGDLFDEWLGDDDDRAPHPAAVDAFAELGRAGVPVHVVHGNHDFLLQDTFRERTGCRLIAETAVVEVRGERVLIMHGDSLCVRDVEYQQFRAYTRDAAVQREFLAMPLAARAERAASLRHSSKRLSELKTADIMDADPRAVADVMRENEVRYLVHGHTHRPAIHQLHLDEASATRIVLGDWYHQDSVLIWDAAGARLGRVAELG